MANSSKSGGKPNILVIWGDDIGISNLSCYSHGLMGYQTPNIDRHREGRDDVHRFVRRAVLHRRPLVVHHRTKRPAHRTFQGGHPGRPDRDEREDPDDRSRAEEPGLRDRPVRQEPPRRPEPHAADQPRLRRVLRQPVPPERRGRARGVRLPAGEGLPEVPRELRSARRDPLVGDRQGRPDRDAALGQGRQAEDRGHRPADQEADGDLRRRFRRRGNGLHQAPEQGRQAVVRVAQHDAHAPVHAHEEGEPRSGRALAVALPRHDDRSRQERRPDARSARRARHRRRHVRACTRPTTGRTATPGPTAP